jgi:hypothetical protein
MHALGATDESHRRHAIALGVEGAMRRFAHRRMIRESEVVIGTQVDDVAFAGANDTALRTAQYALALVKSGGAQASEIAAQPL